MRLRNWQSPIEGLDLGPSYGHVRGGGGVMAVAGIPPKVPSGVGHTHGQRDPQKERERGRRRRAAAAKAATA